LKEELAFDPESNKKVFLKENVNYLFGLRKSCFFGRKPLSFGVCF